MAIGITADSFIVFFERVRDEVRDGRALLAAVGAGWKRARRTILASDAVSFLAAIVLYLLAVGGVRGFAFTLGLTTLVDVVVVFLFTNPMVTLLARTAVLRRRAPALRLRRGHLGRSVAYAGRGRVRPQTGLTIAERRAAERAAAAGTGSPEAADGAAATRRRGIGQDTAPPAAVPERRADGTRPRTG